MLALIVAMIICVSLGAGVVGFVMIEARREGRGEFWTAEGEELIAGVRRTSGRVGEKVRRRGSQLGGTAVERTQAMREKRSVAGGPGPDRRTAAPAEPAGPATTRTGSSAPESGSPAPTDGTDGDLRAAS